MRLSWERRRRQATILFGGRREQVVHGPANTRRPSATSQTPSGIEVIAARGGEYAGHGALRPAYNAPAEEAPVLRGAHRRSVVLARSLAIGHNQGGGTLNHKQPLQCAIIHTPAEPPPTIEGERLCGYVVSHQHTVEEPLRRPMLHPVRRVAYADCG